MTATPAFAIPVFPLTVELNWVMLTVASGSAEFVAVERCTQPLTAFDHIIWIRYWWPLISWLYGEPLGA